MPVFVQEDTLINIFNSFVNPYCDYAKLQIGL